MTARLLVGWMFYGVLSCAFAVTQIASSSDDFTFLYVSLGCTGSAAMGLLDGNCSDVTVRFILCSVVY